PVTVPTQDMILGAYYLTMDREGEKGEGKCFRDFNEANMAYLNGDLGLHAPIRVRVEKERNGKKESQIVKTTLGRMIYNQSVPQNLGFVDRSKPENFFLPEIDFVVGKDKLGEIINRCIARNGTAECAKMLDEIKSLGYKFSTKASFSISVYDIRVPKSKKEHIAAAQAQVEKVNRSFQRGELNEDERYDNVIKIWKETDKKVQDDLASSLNKYNPIMIMVGSGARGSMKQMKQLGGMRGSMFSATGKTIELPIISNFREGMNIAEYFIGARSSRKSLSDTALRTADSGYMTRRLVDVAQDVVIREEKCDTTKGMWVSPILSADGQVLEKLEERILGRYTMGEIIDPRTGEVLVKDDTMISQADVDRIKEAGITRVYIRSVIQCHARRGICAHCYGADLATNQPVTIGEAVGIIAAQSIGEPGTQLTMRTFHSGGIAGSNITQGLPRVDELFEARQPKKPAKIAEHSGVVHISAVENTEQNRITYVSEETGEKVDEVIPYGHAIIVNDGEHVVKGQALTEGSKAPEDIMRIQGLDAVYEYLIKEVQSVYREQSSDINDKHIEIIARQMTRKVRIIEPGSTKLLPTTLHEKQTVEDMCEDIRKRREAAKAKLVELKDRMYKNEEVDAEELRLAQEESELEEPKVEPALLSISKASLLSESFLAAAAFQETMQGLTDAAVRGRVDHLQGLKENVMIGKLMPAGTGSECYQNIRVTDTNPLPELPPLPAYTEEENGSANHSHYGFIDDPSRARRERLRAEARAKEENGDEEDEEDLDLDEADDVDAILDTEEETVPEDETAGDGDSSEKE
ncbi:MAG: DNA-directed RNA polymerase subunit beta', partial [Clostridia bacterium]|nr:DNA-directed RNA polymerase subunit beta' [Clostridia bacterium]